MSCNGISLSMFERGRFRAFEHIDDVAFPDNPVYQALYFDFTDMLTVCVHGIGTKVDISSSLRIYTDVQRLS